MASLKEIRTRIASVGSIRQITSAMKMVAAAKLRRAQDTILQLRPYAEKCHEIMEAISDAIGEDTDNVYVNSRIPNKILLVVISSNKGLAGAFNSSIIKRTVQVVHEKYGKQFAQNNVEFFVIGKKGGDFLKSRNYPIFETRNDIFDDLRYENVAAMADNIMKQFEEGRFDRVEIIYNQFKNAAVQIITEEQFLPLEAKAEDQETAGGIYKTYADYIFEPSKEEIVKELLPKSLKLQFYKAVLDSYASEHGARMTSMHNATDNATELIKDLKLEFNKARQASITNEILEIVNGANALEGS